MANRLARLWASLFGAMAFAQSVAAQTPMPSTAGEAAGESIALWQILTTVAYIAVLAAIAAGVSLYRRGKLSQLGLKVPGDRRIRVIETTRATREVVLVLAEVDRRTILIASSRDAIALKDISGDSSA